MLACAHFIFLFVIDTQKEDIVDIAECRSRWSMYHLTQILSFKLTENVAKGFSFKLLLWMMKIVILLGVWGCILIDLFYRVQEF